MCKHLSVGSCAVDFKHFVFDAYVSLTVSFIFSLISKNFVSDGKLLMHLFVQNF